MTDDHSTDEVKPSSQQGSRQSHRAKPALESHEATPDLDSFQRQLIDTLEIPDSVLARHNVTDLRIAYAKYLAYNNAHSKVVQMIQDGSWKIKSPSAADLIGLFTSKSCWYGGYTMFSEVDKHSDMKLWLEGKSNVGNVELWGKEKTRYTFKDLKAYLAENGDLDLEKGKGKGKERGKVKGKRKAAGSVSEGSGKKKEKKKKKALQYDEESSSSS